jgi:hypothetical protein
MHTRHCDEGKAHTRCDSGDAESVVNRIDNLVLWNRATLTVACTRRDPCWCRIGLEEEGDGRAESVHEASLWPGMGMVVVVYEEVGADAAV